MEKLIKRAFLRGYKTGIEAAAEAPRYIQLGPMDDEAKYKIGQVLEDGYLYAGFYQTDKESYHLAIAPKDEEKEMNWHDAMKLDIPNKAEWFLINLNQGLFNFTRGYYWSSTESNGYYAWIFYVQIGNMINGGKTNTYLVRCVRRFND